MIYHRPVHKTDTAGMLTSHKNATERQRVAKNGTRLANAESACSRATQRVRRRVSPHFYSHSQTVQDTPKRPQASGFIGAVRTPADSVSASRISKQRSVDWAGKATPPALLARQTRDERGCSHRVRALCTILHVFAVHLLLTTHMSRKSPMGFMSGLYLNVGVEWNKPQYCKTLHRAVYWVFLWINSI